MGHQPGRHALHALVPTADGRNGREARQLHLTYRGWPGHRAVRRHVVGAAGAGRQLVPQRGNPEHVRSQGLHLVGSDQSRICRGQHLVHPDDFHQLHGVRSGQQNAAVEGAEVATDADAATDAAATDAAAPAADAAPAAEAAK